MTQHQRKTSAIEPAGLDAPSILAIAREVIDAELRAVETLAHELDGGFTATVRRILACRGRVVVTGMGKSGLVGQKISATLASTGTPSLFLHAAEAVHGDLGRITAEDIVLALSNSGESEEIVRLVRPVRSLGAGLICLVGDPNSTLARHADVAISIGRVAEAGAIGLVPTASTTAMMVVGDALAICLFNLRGFGREDYARFHPGGSLGRRLLKVREVMREGAENPLVPLSASLRQAIVTMTRTEGRPGAASVVDDAGRLQGFFTDGDLRRLLGADRFNVDMPISQVMNRTARTVHPDQLVDEAARIMRSFQIDQVPVVDDQGCCVGFLDVQDLLTTRVI